MKKVTIQSLNIIILLFLLILPYFVFAANSTLNELEAVGVTNGGYTKADETSAAGITGTVVRAVLSILGIIFLILMLYAGYNWMIAHGDESKVEKAKDTLRTSVIGLVIIIGSYAIWQFIFLRLLKLTAI